MNSDKLAINRQNFARVRFQLKFAFIMRPFDFFPVNLLLVQSQQTEIIIVKRLIQGRNQDSGKEEGLKMETFCDVILTTYFK